MLKRKGKRPKLDLECYVMDVFVYEISVLWPMSVTLGPHPLLAFTVSIDWLSSSISIPRFSLEPHVHRDHRYINWRRGGSWLQHVVVGGRTPNRSYISVPTWATTLKCILNVRGWIFKQEALERTTYWEAYFGFHVARSWTLEQSSSRFTIEASAKITLEGCTRYIFPLYSQYSEN